ncbi:MAG: integration host factor subunit beta [Deferribacteraceae bacterium]|jgi:integration host factor subunit beta|nr:integration host factor subunit beta [Deferribacteraceae bacterium]
MTKSELISHIFESIEVMTRQQVEDIVNGVFDEIGSALAQKDKVEIRGFGSFHVRKKKARIGRNPQNGSPVEIAETWVPFFRPSIDIKKQLIAGKLPDKKLKKS